MNHEFMPAQNEAEDEIFPQERSENRYCEMYVQEIKRLGNQEDAGKYISMISEEDCAEYGGADGFLAANPGYEEKVSEALSDEEVASLREYSGYNYKAINSVLRGFWDYEQLGAKTEESEKRFRAAAEAINGAIDKAPDAEEDFMTFRGTNLDSFRGYGVESIADLAKMQGQFHLERGFLSTSVEEEGSYAGRESFDDPLKPACNISMRYKIPAGTHEGILLTGDASYSPSQSEYLIRSGSLSYISNVEISEDGGSAVVDCVLVPRQFYEQQQ